MIADVYSDIFKQIAFSLETGKDKYNTWAHYSEIDSDAYCVCTHDFLLRAHNIFKPVHTMYAVKSAECKQFRFLR